MGRSIARLAPEHGFCLAVAVAAPMDADQVVEGVLVTSELDQLSQAGVIIDFSHPLVLARAASIASAYRIPLVSGTTNLNEETLVLLTKASEQAPVLWSPNMSLGIAVLAELVERAAKILGNEYDIEIVETHHRRKIDAPSGTAKRLADAVELARTDLTRNYGRVGEVGARPPTEVGIHAVRGGDVVGDHAVCFYGPSERLEFIHRAENRDLFAHGALRAARFLVGRPPKLYRMADMMQEMLDP
jgi:4-hydroxy-tetrahydrodipicolinate reductase